MRAGKVSRPAGTKNRRPALCEPTGSEIDKRDGVDTLKTCRIPDLSPDAARLACSPDSQLPNVSAYSSRMRGHGRMFGGRRVMRWSAGIVTQSRCAIVPGSLITVICDGAIRSCRIMPGFTYSSADKKVNNAFYIDAKDPPLAVSKFEPAVPHPFAWNFSCSDI